VREALRTLSARGLITIAKGKGIFVRESSSDIIRDHLHIYLQLNSERNYVIDIIRSRQMIEPSIAYFAALNHTKEDETRLQQDIETLKNCDESFIHLAKLDMQFHLDIAKASQNSIMPLILDPIHKLMPEIKSSVYATNKDAKESAIIWHQRILDEIIRRDADGARRAMGQHLKIAEEHAEKMLKAQIAVSKETSNK
jgi:GntR family transcriptional repressor for pyruvate dehydrogenase complex